MDIILPLLVFVIFKGLKLETYMVPALIMAAMPSGLNTIIFPKNLGRSPELGAKMALISHVLSCITVPVWLSLL